MPTINQLPLLAQISGGDNIPVYSPTNGDARRVSITSLIEYFQETFADPNYLTIINAPTNSGFNIQIGTQTQSVFLILNPSGAFAAGTITLPPVASCFDGQEILVASSQTVTALTVNGNGAAVYGIPLNLGLGGFFTIRFNQLQNSWYTISSNTAGIFSLLTVLGSIKDVNGNELITISATASAVNEITIANAAAGSAPAISATGDDVNINLNLVPKGSGVLLANNVPVVTTTAAQTLTNKTLTQPVTTGLRRAAPVTKTADFVLDDTDDYVINNKAGSACVVGLPSAGAYIGRVVTIKTIQAQAVNSVSSNVVPRAGGAAGTAIVSGTAGNWAELVSDGSNWVIMAGS